MNRKGDYLIREKMGWSKLTINVLKGEKYLVFRLAAAREGSKNGAPTSELAAFT